MLLVGLLARVEGSVVSRGRSSLGRGWCRSRGIGEGRNRPGSGRYRRRRRRDGKIRGRGCCGD
jgi:hypothetical protein